MGGAAPVSSARFCGGCRCRAYATYGDYLAEDPACAYQPGQYGGTVIDLPATQTFGLEVTQELRWEEAARERLKAIPSFARGMVIKAVEAYARAHGQQVVTPALLADIRQTGGALPPSALFMAIHREEDNVTNTTPEDIAGRLEAMEERLARLETLLVGLTQQLEHQRTDPTKVVASIQTWVTDYVSMRLQQLVPRPVSMRLSLRSAMGLISPDHRAMY